jgi:cardiolipin synthase
MLRPQHAAEEPLPPPLDYALSLQGVTHHNAARLLPGGAHAFPEMLTAIAEAKREVLLESYTIADDATGRGFLDAAAEAAKRGVTVRLLTDDFGSLSLPSARLAALEEAGAQTLVYRPVAPWRRRWGLFARDHRKILVVDRSIGFVGGLNLADDYDERTEVGRYWRDLHLRLEGPSVAALGALFTSTWNKHCDKGRRFRYQRTAASVPAVGSGVKPGGVSVQVVGNRETRHRSLIRRSFLHAVRSAKRTIWIANPYFIPDGAIARALTRAARHGIDVRVLVPAHSDVPLCDWAARATFARLLRAGVRIAEWSLGMMHAKAAAVDGRWATVGSYNLDRRSLRYNLEVTANLFDEQLGTALEKHIASDFARSTELALATFKKRSWWRKVLSWAAYQLRAWL